MEELKYIQSILKDLRIESSFYNENKLLLKEIGSFFYQGEDNLRFKPNLGFVAIDINEIPVIYNTLEDLEYMIPKMIPKILTELEFKEEGLEILRHIRTLTRRRFSVIDYTFPIFTYRTDNGNGGKLTYVLSSTSVAIYDSEKLVHVIEHRPTKEDFNETIGNIHESDNLVHGVEGQSGFNKI